jgi:23S rRNA pseudouridine2605 synthase
MRPPRKSGGNRPPPTDERREQQRGRPEDRNASRQGARPNPPRASDDAIFTSRRDVERVDTARREAAPGQRREAAPSQRREAAPDQRRETPAADRRRHIPGGRLPKLPASEPKQVPRPPRGDRPARTPEAFSDLPTRPAGRRDAAEVRAAPTGRRGRGEARVAERQAARTNSAVPVEPQRIAKLLARAGVGSRRDIERMIAQGEVALNGQVLTTPATIVASLDGITVRGDTVAALEPSRLFRFHKPAGFLTTARDPGGRPTIMDIMPPGLPRVVPVGRLDMNTEGLILLTTDGALKRALELPMSGVPRRYRVRAYGEIGQQAVESLIEGLTIDGMRYGPIDAEIERRTGRNLWLTMTLTEGKNREIRRVLEHLGLQVSRLIRVAYGPVELGDLAPRDADEVPDGVVASLRKSLARKV